MADWFRRIKAAPQVLLLLLLAFSMIGYCALREEADGADRLEKQASAVLSRMEGAGRVEVTIMTRKAQTGGTGLMKGETGGEVPCGAMAWRRARTIRWCGCSLNRRFVRCWACPIRR